MGPTDMTVCYTDAAGGNSEPITVHGDSGEDALNAAGRYVDNIDRCNPPTAVRKFLGFVITSECSAPKA